MKNSIKYKILRFITKILNYEGSYGYFFSEDKKKVELIQSIKYVYIPDEYKRYILKDSVKRQMAIDIASKLYKEGFIEFEEERNGEEYKFRAKILIVRN